MSNIQDSNDVISITEKVNTLWKTYNNLINTKPSGTSFSETLPFENFVIQNELLNKNIPINFALSNDISLDILDDSNNIQSTINISSSNFSFLTIENLDTIFNSNNINEGLKCNFGVLGYPYLEYYYKKECYPTILNGGNSNNQIYTWFIPDPSNGNISFSTTKNLLKNTIPNKFDPYNNTYQYRLYYKNSNNNFQKINFASFPDFAYLDNKSGFLYFYGGTRTGNDIILSKFRAQSVTDSNKSPPYLSYIKYNGNTGFENLIMNGLINIDGSLNINNDLSFIDISNNLYNVLNTKQITEYINSLNISGGSGGSGLTLDQILKSNNDASLNSLDISGILKGTSGTYSNNQLALGSHIIPISNADYDLGNAEYKIRHLFLSDNSIWIGDKHKIDISNNNIYLKKRNNNVPQALQNSPNYSESELLTNAKTRDPSINNINDLLLEDYINYGLNLDPPLDIQTIYDQNASNWENNIDLVGKLDSNILILNKDASFNNVDISGFLRINEQVVASKQYIDNSFTQISSFNELSSNFYDLSSNFSILDAQVQNICGANFALKINEISGDVLLIESDVLSISGRIDNIKTIVNNLDVSYLTDSAFELSYNDLSNIYITNSLFNELSSNFSILESSFINLDLSNSLDLIDSSLTNLQNNIENINANISNKFSFDNIELLNTNSVVNIVNSKYVFNGSNTYDASKNYGLRIGSYVLKDVSSSHPIALLNNDVSNLITYNVIDNSPIIIKVSGGEDSSPYYNFNDSNDNSININDFKFMRNRSYQFTANGISSSHPLKIYVNNSFTNVISGSSGNINFTINSNHSLVDGDFYYICNIHPTMNNNLSILNNNVNGINYDFYYGDISINVLGDFGNVSVYCFYHGYMGGQNLLVYLSNYYTTTTDVIQDLSSLFFNTITPTKNTSNILININANLYCSYALEERISVQLWRDLSMLNQSNNLGSVIATGGLTIPYNLNYLDTPNNNSLTKYYLKYILENNNSLQEMGLINIQNNSNYGNSNIILREI
tara:strand:+ start:3170 stop:6214 length:3045 start_codon:yes stop_codon:yes gene_type:complete